MTLSIGLGLLGNATQWVLPGFPAPLPEPLPGAPVPGAIAETLVAPPTPILAFGGQVSITDGPGGILVDVVGAWNSVKNGRFISSEAEAVTMSGFVHADVSLGGGGDSSVRLLGAKRGNVVTAEGDDSILIEVATNGTAWINEFRVRTGEGDDLVVVGALDIAAAAAVDATFRATANRAGAFTGNDAGTIVIAVLGAGEDRFVGLGQSRDQVSGGGGDDILVAGAGNDVLTGGAGEDIFVFATGDGADRITDFTQGEDRIILSDLSIGEIEAALEGAVVQGGGTLIALGADSLFLAGVTTPLTLDDLL